MLLLHLDYRASLCFMSILTIVYALACLAAYSSSIRSDPLDRYGTLGVGGGSYIYAGAGEVAAEQIPPYAYSVPYLSSPLRKASVQSLPTPLVYHTCQALLFSLYIENRKKVLNDPVFLPTYMYASAAPSVLYW